MKPLLAHVYEEKRVTYPCFVQCKLNGVRALYQNGFFQSRDEIPFPFRVLEHLAKPLLQLFEPDVILDGELYVHGWPLQRINGAVTPIRQEPNEDTLQIEYHVFDRVDFNLSFGHRHCYLNRHDLVIDQQLSQIKFVDNFVVDPNSNHKDLPHILENANIAYAQYIKEGYEGMMYRLGDCPYTVPKQPSGVMQFLTGTKSIKYLSDQDNRVWHLLKRKSWQDGEFDCSGVEEGEGKYRNSLGALRCWSKKYPAHKPAFSVIRQTEFTVSSGLTDAERAVYWANPPIGRLIKVRYLCLSSSGIPLNPSILAIL